jgi:hypothetical protein
MKTGKNEILFPIFLEASLQTQDSFWIYLFEDLAYSICPFGSFIDKDTVCCKFKGKQFNFKFSDKTPKVIFEQLYDLFRTKLNICSSSDYCTKRLKFNNILENKHSEWKDIKKKNIKDIFIENYVIDMKLKHGLTNLQAQKFLHIITIGFNFKIITNSDIDYRNGKINHIHGVSWNEKLVIPRIEPHEIPITIKPRLKDFFTNPQSQSAQP